VLPASVEESLPKLKLWADLINSGDADKLKETELLPDFLTDIFGTLLGYTEPIRGGDHYTMSWEKHVEVYGEFADDVLGRFCGEKRDFIVALEGKGTRNPLGKAFTIAVSVIVPSHPTRLWARSGKVQRLFET